jgi:predicted RNase H-like nuclease (RuvC/YqgF family)
MRKLLYPIVVVLMLVVVVVDHYTVNTYLSEFEGARNYNLAEMVQAYQMQDVALASQGLQETLMITSRRLEKSEGEVVECIKYIRQLRETNLQQESVVLSSAATIKELTDDNARIQKELDATLVKLELKSQALDAAKKEIETLKATTKDLKKVQKELDAVKKTLATTIEDVQWVRTEYERRTGEVAPLPPNSLK